MTYRSVPAIILMVLGVCFTVSAAPPDSPLNYHQSFDDFGFLEEDFVARSGLKTADDRGMTIEEGRFGKGLRMNLTPKIVTLHEMSGADLDMVTGAMFRTGARRKQWVTDNEPFLWGAAKVNPLAGSIAFWVKGPLTEGVLFNQSAMRCGRPEQYLLSITVDDDLMLGAYIEDARYERHTIASKHRWNADTWNHVVLNWDRAQGLELFINGRPAASSWGKDSWWETPLPGLMHFPMPHVIYDEFYSFSRPLTDVEIEALMASNTPPESPSAVRRSTADRDRLARAFGLGPDLDLPEIRPLPDGRALSFREVTPAFTGDGNIPDRFCRDGRYELAWPHPLAVFTPIPGDASFQAEKLDVAVGKCDMYNWVTMEGNLTGLPAALTGAVRDGDRFRGEPYFTIPEDNRFFYGARFDRKRQSPFTLPFLKGFGAPQHFTGDLHLPLTGDTRIQELTLFDVNEEDIDRRAGGLAFHLRRGGDLEYRYDFAMRALNPLVDRETLYGYLTPPESGDTMIETGYLTRLNLMTAPMTGKRCFGKIVLDLDVRTQTDEDVLLVRLRDPALPYRIWTHAEVRMRGFRNGGRLRLMLEPPPLILAEGDRIWLDIASRDNMRFKVGGPETGRIVLVPAPFFESEPLYEMKALMPVLAECTKAHYQPWLFEKIWPDILHPHTYGGHFDSLVPALAVKRVLPHSRIAEQYIELGNKPEGHLRELEKSEDTVTAVESAYDIPAGVPKWAWLQHKIQNFRYRVVEWMLWNQNPDGQLAEGWNDDPFMINTKYDMLLDSFPEARDMHLRFFEGLDDTNILGDGWIRIAPLDSLHAWDFHCERWQSVLTKPGDPYIIRRALKSAWYLGKPDRTPQYYNNGEPFMYSHNVLQWYWGLNARRSYTSRDTEQVLASLESMLGECDDIHFFRFTEAWNTMRSLSGERLFSGMIVGGWEHGTRNPHVEDRSITVSWPEGGGEDLARWITSADSTGLTCRMFAFDPLPRNVTARLYRIDAGTYEITLSEDKDGSSGDVLYTETRNLNRYDAISVTVPSKTPVILTVRQTKKARVDGLLPDLAVAPYDCERSGSTLRVRVSNVGAARSKQASVTVFDRSGAKIAEKSAGALDAPTDFVEKSVWVEFDGIPAQGELRVVVDGYNNVAELYEGNNRAVVE